MPKPTKPNRASISSARRRNGAAAVEFAIIAPLFLLLLAGIIEFGQAFRVQHSLSTAARLGARAAIVDGSTNSEVTRKVKAAVEQALNVKGEDVTVAVAVNGSASGSLGQATEGDEISVTVSIPYSKVGAGFYVNTFAKSTISSSIKLEHE